MVSQSESSSPGSRDKAHAVNMVKSGHLRDIEVEFGCTHHVSIMCNPVLFNQKWFNQGLQRNIVAWGRAGVDYIAM